jgi:hypothetical protein
VLAVACALGRPAVAKEIWVGTSTFGVVEGALIGGTTTNKGHTPNIRPEPHRIQSESMRANPRMTTPDVLIDAGGGEQVVFVNEGDIFQYTIRLTHPPGTTRSNDIIDDKRDTVQVWLSSSQEVMQEEAPGQFYQHRGHRTQLVIATDGPGDCTGITTCNSTSESQWDHGAWVLDPATGYSASLTRLLPGGQTTQSSGEALLVFNGTNWHVPQTVRVTARQDDVYEPQVDRRGQQAYVHHRVEMPEGCADRPVHGPEGCNYQGISVNDLTVSIEDDDPAVVLQNTSDPIPTEGSLHSAIALKLASEPMENVNVTLFSGPVRHPDVPEQVRFFSENSAVPGVNYYEFTPLDWDTWRSFRVEAVNDDVDEWSYNGQFRSSEIGYKIESGDYYYRNNGTSCLNRRLGSRSSMAEIQQPHQQCVCVYEDVRQVHRFQPDQYHSRGMECGAVATPIDNNYRFVNISLVNCSATEGGANCDYTVRLNSAPGFNPYDWNHDLPSRVVVHLREENEIEGQSSREHELYFTEWLQVTHNASNTSASAAAGLMGNSTEVSNVEICQKMNATVLPLINRTCRQDVHKLGDPTILDSHGSCSMACEGLVVPYFEQCVYKNSVRGFEIKDITPAAQEILSLYRQCSGIVFDGEMIGLVWKDRTDGRGGSKTFGQSTFHEYGYQIQAGWELDLVFDNTNWNVTRLISVVAFNDDVDEPDELRTIYHTTTVEERHKLDVDVANGTIKSDIVTNDPTYFPHNKTIDIASVAVRVFDNDVADVLLGCRSYDSDTQIGSIEGYGGFENKVPRSFRFTPGESEKEGELACVVHTQECAPKDKDEVKFVYSEKWRPRNLTDPKNCSDWITYDQIMGACCTDSTGLINVDCASGVPSTCTRACSLAFPDFYLDCWPEMNQILVQNPNVTQQEADYFQLQCIAVGVELTQKHFTDRGVSSCLPLLDGGADSIRTAFKEKCCPDIMEGTTVVGNVCEHTVTADGVHLPDDCSNDCSQFFKPIFAACKHVWVGTDYHLDMVLDKSVPLKSTRVWAGSAGLYGEAELEAVYNVCYRYEGTEYSVDWVYHNDQKTCISASAAYQSWAMANPITVPPSPTYDPTTRPKGDNVRLDDCFSGSMGGYLSLPPTLNMPTKKWQIEFVNLPDGGVASDKTDFAIITVSGTGNLAEGVTKTVYNDVRTPIKFEVESTVGTLVYKIEFKTGCQPDSVEMIDCYPTYTDSCPCPLTALNEQLHMKIKPGYARALSPPRTDAVTVVQGNVTSNTTNEEVQDLPCTLGSYTVRLNTDPGTKRIRTTRDSLSDFRRMGQVEGPTGGDSSNGDMLNNAGIPGKKGGGGPFEHAYARAVPRMDYDYELKPITIEVTPDPTPHTRYETSHGGKSCKFTRANWDKECVVTAIPTMDPLLRTPYDVYWNSRQILDHTAHTVTQSFFGKMHGYHDEYWNYTVPYQLYTPGPGPHGQDIGEVPTASDSPIMSGDHLSENAQEFCTIRKGAYEEERYTKDGGSGAAGDKSAHSPGVYDEVLCRWGGRRTHVEGTPNKYGPYVLWNQSLYRHPIQIRYVMVNTYELPLGGDFGAAVASAPHADPLLSFAQPIAGSLLDMAFGPRIEDVSDARRCANYCLRQAGCNSFDFAPQQHRCYLNSGYIDKQVEMVMIDDLLPAGMQQRNPRSPGTISTVALSQAYYHHYKLRKAAPPPPPPVDNSKGTCEHGPHLPADGLGSLDTERTGLKYRAAAVPLAALQKDGGAAFCIRQCCKSTERDCVAWVVRQPVIGANCSAPADNCGGIIMDNCVSGVSKCCFLVAADVTAVLPPGMPVVDPVGASGDAITIATGSLSGVVTQDHVWSTIHGLNYMPTYAANAIELWRDYDYFAVERELAVAERGGYNLVRVPLSYQVWANNETDGHAVYASRLRHFVSTAFSRGMRTVPVIFDMMQHPNVPRCTLHALEPNAIEDSRKCWYPSPGYTRSDNISWWVTEGHDYLQWLVATLPYHNGTEGMFLWDVVNAPEEYPAPRPDARPNVPRRPAKVPNVANASSIIGASVSGPGISYRVPTVRHLSDAFCMPRLCKYASWLWCRESRLGKIIRGLL